MTTLDDAAKDLRSDLSSGPALEACVAGMVREERLSDHALRETICLATRRQGFRSLDLAVFLLRAMSREHRVVHLVDGTSECQLRLFGHDVGIQGGTPHFPGACDVVALQGDREYAFLAGRRLLVDLLMEPESVLPPAEGPTLAWRLSQIGRYVARVREIGLAAPEVNADRLDESGELGISLGEAMTDVRGGESHKWSVARFRVVHRGLVYRCRFVRPFDPEFAHPEAPDYVECDPRFATAPSGSSRYVAPVTDFWGPRCYPPKRGSIVPFGHVVTHVQRGDMKWKMQTPYDLLSAVRAYSRAWKAGPQKSAVSFARLVERLGMRGWFKLDPADSTVWRLVYEKSGASLDVVFHERTDGFCQAKLQFSFAGSSVGCRPVWIRTPRRFYEVVRDSFWTDRDGRKLYKPGDVAPWVAAMHEDRPVDDGIG